MTEAGLHIGLVLVLFLSFLVLVQLIVVVFVVVFECGRVFRFIAFWNSRNVVVGAIGNALLALVSVRPRGGLRHGDVAFVVVANRIDLSVDRERTVQESIPLHAYSNRAAHAVARTRPRFRTCRPCNSTCVTRINCQAYFERRSVITVRPSFQLVPPSMDSSRRYTQLSLSDTR